MAFTPTEDNVEAQARMPHPGRVKQFAARQRKGRGPHSKLLAFGVFAIGYLMRPIGGVLVGHIGDRFGRRTALIFSVTAMAIPTFLMGLLPSYQTIGLLAPIRAHFAAGCAGAFSGRRICKLDGVPDRACITAGWLSDRVGRKPLMLLASMGGLIGA